MGWCMKGRGGMVDSGSLGGYSKSRRKMMKLIVYWRLLRCQKSMVSGKHKLRVQRLRKKGKHLRGRNLLLQLGRRGSFDLRRMRIQKRYPNDQRLLSKGYQIVRIVRGGEFVKHN